jgi:hypothetical protein
MEKRSDMKSIKPLLTSHSPEILSIALKCSTDDLIDISFPLLLRYGIHISLHVITARHLSCLEKEGYEFIKNVKKEDKIIYA